MGINLRCLHIRVAEQLLHGTNVLTGLKQMSRERMTKGVRRSRFNQSRTPYRLAYRTLNGFLMHMMAKDVLGTRILRTIT